MKYADRRGAPCVVIQGGDERAKGEVQIKDLIEGARLSAEITDNTAWREGRPAQVTVPEGELVRDGAADPGGAGGRAQPWQVNAALLAPSFSPCGRRWPREARSDEGCSGSALRPTLLHPSPAATPSPTRGEGRSRA